MWTYKQSTGELFDPIGGRVSADAYSGYGEYRNKPQYQDKPHLGCLPRGLYIMLFAVDHPHLGPVAIQLIPHPANQMYGRSEFFLHGKGKDNPATAEDESLLSSHGCMCDKRSVRDEVNSQDDRVLSVIL